MLGTAANGLYSELTRPWFRLTCPSEIAYGEGGRPPVIPGGAVLIFDVELLDVMKAPPPPPPMESTPPPPAEAPGAAKKKK